MTPEVVGKLHSAFAVGANDTEACRFKGISRDLLYDYIKKDEGFSDIIEGVKDRPILKSKSKMAVELSPGYAAVLRRCARGLNLRGFNDESGVV